MSKSTNRAGIFTKVVPLLFFVVMIWVLLTVVSTAVKLLYGYLAIPLLLIALFLNYSVVTDYFTGLFRDIREDTGKGLIKAAATAVGYPFVFGYLALKAYTKRALGSNRPSVKDQRKQKTKDKGDYVKYEEVDDNEDFLDLEDLDKAHAKQKVKSTQHKSNNDYEDLFS